MMAGSVFSVVLVVTLKALMHAHYQRAAFLWITLLVTVITADSPVSDEPHLEWTLRSMDFLKGVPTSTGSSPSALPTSHFTAFGDPDLLPSIPQPNHEAITANAMKWEHVTRKNSKTFMPSDLREEAPHPPTPPMSPSEPVLASNPQLETLTKFSTDWKLARTNSTLSHSPTAVISQLQPQPNATSLTPPTSSMSAVPQFHFTPEQTSSDALLAAYSEQNDGASKQNLPILTSLPGQPLLKPTKVMFPDYQADAPDPNQSLKASTNVLDMSFRSPSSAPLPESKPAHVPNMLLNPDDILAPSFYVPFFSPHPTSPLSEPTEVSPEEFFPTNTMDVDWGSGDYLETMSFLGSEGDDYSMVTKVPSDMYDIEDSTESYDTSFPSRVGISLSSLHPLHVSSSPSLMTAHSTIDPSTSIYLSSSSPALHFIITPTPSLHSDITEASAIDWFDTYTIEPTDVLLPDMNSLEYYTTQLKENANSDTGAEQRGNITMVPIGTTDMAPTSGSTDDGKLYEQESSSDLSGFEPINETTPVLTTEESHQLVNVSRLFLDPSIATSLVLESSSSVWGTPSAVTLTTEMDSSVLTAILPNATAFLPEVVISSSLTDVHWFETDDPFVQSMIYSTPVVTATITFTPGPTEPVANTAASPTTEKSPQNTSITTELTLNATEVSNETTSLVPPVMVGDQGVTEDGADIPATVTLIPANSDANTVSAVPTATTASTTPHQATTKIAATAEASTNDTIISKTSIKTPTTAQTSRQYLCRVDKPIYLVKMSFPSGATIGYAKSQIRDILKVEFNRSVELQVIDPPPKFVFRVVSGPVVYTAISVVNSLRRSGRRFLSVSPNWTTPDNKYQVHTVLQFVPSHIDVRYCNFSESIEKGLTKAFAEVCRRSKESTNFTVHIVNITMAPPKYQEQRLVRQPVDITFTVRGSRGYLMGSEVSNSLMKLTMVEFSYYMGFPVLQIAEPFHYPELNTSDVLRSSWVKTVLLGVLDQKVGERTFQANMERRVAMLLGEAMGVVRRVKRATSIGNSSVQIVSANRLVGTDHPMEIVYFVEDPSGQRVPATQTANLLNSLDVQRAAIVLGYRVQGILAQPLEKVATSPSESENTNLWIVIGVVIPLLVVIIIISILYWKLCRTDKLEFQPDAMTSIQQRQKSTTSLGESRTSLPQTTRSQIELSEEEEWEYEEEEEEEEYEEEDEEQENVKGRKRPVAPLKSKQCMTIEEEEEGEEEEEEEEEEEYEEGEEEEDEDKDEENGKINKRESKLAQQTQQKNVAKLKEAGEMKKEEKSKLVSKGRRTQEELQAPSVKGFDFAKLHLGQQSKDDVMVIQEPLPSGPGPLPMSIKDGLSPSENGEIPTPISKNSASSTKASRTSRRRGRISPSDGDSVLSDHSSERELTEENLRGHATPSDGKQTRKIPINVLNGPPPMNGTNEQLSSASIFEHVDRMSRATDASRRLPNKVQLIAMQPMPVPPLHSPTSNGKLSDTNQINKEIQVALRHKSEIEHHRNKIRLRAKRKGHYDFPAMDDTTTGLGDLKDQDRIYQKAQMQIDKILDPDSQMPPIFMESKKSGRGRRSPKQRMKEQLNGGMMEADKDHLITEDNDAAYRKCPGVNNVAYVSDPDQGPGSPHRSPSPTDDVFLGPTSSPPGHAPPPPPYMPPQPSIEEARQQMHSLLDDAFALVSPTSQGSTAGITLPGVNNNNHSSSSPPGRSARPWGPSYQALGPFPSRFSDLSLSPPAAQGLVTRQGIGSSYLPPGETAGHSEQLQPDSLYSSRGLYTDELPSSARPRPVGGTTGAQLHHLTQVGLSSRMNGYPAGLRAAPGQNGGIGWSHYHDEPEKDAFLDCPDYTSSSIFQMPRSGIREPSAPPAHLDPAGVGYLSAPPPLDTAPSTHSSASLIKAIREELLRLSQKQSAVSSYHS